MQKKNHLDKLAQQILQLEIKLDQNCDIDTIKKLNELYGIGIDEYMDVEPLKACHFQKKVRQLLRRPSIISALEMHTSEQKLTGLKGSKSSKNIRWQANEYKPNQYYYQQNLKRQYLKFEIKAQQEIQKIIGQSNRAARRRQQLKTKDLTKQQQNLNGRILSRAKSSQRFLSCKNIK